VYRPPEIGSHLIAWLIHRHRAPPWIMKSV
jgi:hypothetical protein